LSAALIGIGVAGTKERTPDDAGLTMCSLIQIT
jgi:hypothetical protein